MTRTDRHAPTEISSKTPVSVVRDPPALANAPRLKHIDPRFDRSMGSYNADLCRKSYSFINDLQHRELAMIREQLRDKSVPQWRKEELQRLLDRAVTKQKQMERDARRHALVKEWRQTESELVKTGKKQPYYLKQSDIRKMELVDQFKRMREANPGLDVDKVVEKKRKRKASKQHRMLPERRVIE